MKKEEQLTGWGELAGAALRTGRVELALKVEQLAHEVEIGRDVGLAPAHEVVGVVERHGQLVHQVGHRDRHRTRDAGQTVHQHALLTIARRLCRREQKQKENGDNNQNHVQPF